LHCFVEKIPTTQETETYCAAVYYYKNSRSRLDLFSKLPFSVRSRQDKKLLANLEAIDAPILFESLKTTCLVYQDQLAKRRKILRFHNIEHLYFEGIAASEKNLLRKLVFKWEAFKYKGYEKILSRFDRIAALSHYENNYVNSHFGNSTYIPVFHGNEKVSNLDGIGKYALYHGDLRMSDNKRVAENLIEVFREIPDVELVIAAGAAFEDYFTKRIKGLNHIKYVTLKDFAHLKQLINDSHINLVFSYQKSGTKLKLMNALFYGRFCIINDNIMDDPKIQPLCEIANTNQAIIDQVNRLKHISYHGYAQRQQLLETHMSDYKNAQTLVDLIFG